MNTRWFLFAQELESFSTMWRRMNTSGRDYIVIFGSVALVTLTVVIWAVYFRKRHRHHHHHHHHSSGDAGQAQSAEGVPSTEGSGRRRRRRRRAHRPRNPTLAETGGLPPVRPERPPEPFP